MSPQTGFSLKLARTVEAEAYVGRFNEATGFDSEAEVTKERRSTPNGHTDIVQIRAGARRLGALTVARPITDDKGLWEWWRRADQQHAYARQD